LQQPYDFACAETGQYSKTGIARMLDEEAAATAARIRKEARESPMRMSPHK